MTTTTHHHWAPIKSELVSVPLWGATLAASITSHCRHCGMRREVTPDPQHASRWFTRWVAVDGTTQQDGRTPPCQPEVVTWSGANRADTGAVGHIHRREVAQFVEARYRAGWRWLQVTDPATEEEVGSIVYDPPTGRRDWWAENSDQPRRGQERST